MVLGPELPLLLSIPVVFVLILILEVSIFYVNRLSNSFKSDLQQKMFGFDYPENLFFQGKIDDRFIENPFRCSVELENTICPLSKSRYR